MVNVAPMLLCPLQIKKVFHGFPYICIGGLFHISPSWTRDEFSHDDDYLQQFAPEKIGKEMFSSELLVFGRETHFNPDIDQSTLW